MSYFQRLLVGTDRNFATIEIDAMLSEQYELNSQITSSPIDFGTEIADHIINDPRLYTIEAVVTDTPMGLLAAIQTLGNNVKQALGYLSSAITGTEQDAPATARSVAAWQSLVALWESKAAINVQSGMGLLENLAIRNLRVRVDKDTANQLRFTCIMQEVNRVYTQVLGETDTLEPGPVQQSGAPVQNKGLVQEVQDITGAYKEAAARFFG